MFWLFRFVTGRGPKIRRGRRMISRERTSATSFNEAVYSFVSSPTVESILFDCSSFRVDRHDDI